MTIIAVIVTYRRPTTLTQTLAGITSQSRPADRIVVVDNDADDAVRDLLSDRPNVDYIASPSNVGYGAALALVVCRGIDRLGQCGAASLDLGDDLFRGLDPDERFGVVVPV